VVDSSLGAETSPPPSICLRLSSINKRPISAHNRLRPFQIVPRLKCKPVEGGGVEGEGKAECDLGGDRVSVSNEGFYLIGGYAGATGESGGVEGVGDEVGVQQDVAGGSQRLRGVHIRMRGEVDQFHGGLPLSGTAARRIGAYSAPCQ